MLSKCQQTSETSTISCQVLFIILRIKMHLVIYDLSDQVFAFSPKIYQLSDISIESLKKLTWDSSKSKLSNSGCILSWLLNLVQTLRHARPCLQDLNESQGIPNCWEVWFWRSQLSLRLNAKIIGWLSYFISPMAGGITDIRQGPGPRSPRCHVACHEVLTNGRCSSWHALLYFVRMMNSLFHDRRVSIVPIRGVHVPSYCCLHLLHGHIISLVMAWSPQPPIMSELATNSGGHKTQHSAPSVSEGTLTLDTESVPPLNTLTGSGQFWHYEEVIMNHFRISCFVHKLIIMSKNRKLYIFFTIWPKTHFGQEQERIVVTLPIEINTGLPYLPISSRHLNISWNIKYPSVPQMTQEGTIRPGNDYEPLAGEIDEAASNNQNNRPG